MPLKFAQIDPGLPDHRKTKRLGRRLEIPHMQAVGLVATLMCRTAANHETGDLSSCDRLDLAEYCGWEGDARALVDALEGERWLDGQEGSWSFHGWPERYESVFRERARQKARRDGASGPPAEPPQTPPGASAEEPEHSAEAPPSVRGASAETGDKEVSKEVRKKETNRARAAPDSLSLNFKTFWGHSNGQGDQLVAYPAWQAHGYDDRPIGPLCAAWDQYVRYQERAKLPVCKAETWIVEGRADARYENRDERQQRQRTEAEQARLDQARKDWPKDLPVVLDGNLECTVAFVKVAPWGGIEVVVETEAGHHRVTPDRLERAEEVA